MGLLDRLCRRRPAGYGRAMRRRRFLILGLVGAGAALAGGAVWRSFSTEIAEARARTRGRSEVFESRFGAMEYAVAGTGPPVLMIHGTGGGFDQGLAFTEPLVAAGWQIVAPSRFGYLRSDFPDDPSSENQADAFVDLLDRLGIDRVPVIGGSAGALSAMAVRDPPPGPLRGARRAGAGRLRAGPPTAAAAERARRGHHRLRAALGLPVLARHDDGRGRDDRHAARHRPCAGAPRRARRSRRGSGRSSTTSCRSATAPEAC